MPLTLKQRQGCPALPDQCVSKTDSMPGSFTGFPMDFSYGFFLWIFSMDFFPAFVRMGARGRPRPRGCGQSAP